MDRALESHVGAGERVAVALSGGRDSVALLAAACQARPGLVVAIHVNHGLSPNADAWTASCRALAASLHVPLSVRRVQVHVDDARGIEAAARAQRYAALRDAARELGVRAVLLAHHQDDQAETLLLQLGRGAGPHGLAAMPVARRDADGLVWLRPWLDVPREGIERFVRERALAYVDDDSNASMRHRRNAVRQRVVPAFETTFPGFRATLARSAALHAETARLADDLADIDAAGLVVDGALDGRGLAALAPHRARNLLRRFLRGHGLRAPSARRIATMLDQLRNARHDARVRVEHDGGVIELYRGRLFVHGPTPPRYERRWHGEQVLAVPHGALRFVDTVGKGISRTRLAAGDVVVRDRRGGERFQPSADRPRRALKLWLQDAGIPPWERAALPLLFCGEALVAVPGLGVDVTFAAAPDAPAIELRWEPDSRASPAIR